VEYGELLIMPANGRQDLIRRLKVKVHKFSYVINATRYWQISAILRCKHRITITILILRNLCPPARFLFYPTPRRVPFIVIIYSVRVQKSCFLFMKTCVDISAQRQGNQKSFVVLCSLSRQTPGQYLNLGYYCLPTSIPLNFSITIYNLQLKTTLTF